MAYTAIPAELTDALRTLGPFFKKLATVVENTLPVFAEMVPAIGTFIEAAEASQPEILAVIEVIKYLQPALKKIYSIISTVLAPILETLAKIINGALAPALA